MLRFSFAALPATGASIPPDRKNPAQALKPPPPQSIPAADFGGDCRFDSRDIPLSNQEENFVHLLYSVLCETFQANFPPVARRGTAGA